MLADATARRGELPVVGLALTQPPHAGPVADWVRERLGAYARAGGHLHSSVAGAPHPHDHAHTH